MISGLIRELKSLKDPAQAKVLQRFFKTGKGEYGEGDVFLGIKVPVQRKVARKYFGLQLTDIRKLLASKIHEHRLVALLILIQKYEYEEKTVYDLYLKKTRYINNWDLVDLSAPKIVGQHLLTRDRKVLYRLAKSRNLWERRIAIVSTFTFIRNGDYKDTLKLARLLLHDRHDLIHKAAGWMLREIGKRDQKILETFLKQHAKVMPRTMLRYAIERFDKKKRDFYKNV